MCKTLLHLHIQKPQKMKNTTLNQSEIKIGDFIKGSYKFGCIYGIVTKVNKTKIIIMEYRQWYNEYTMTNILVNVTKSRISSIGLSENEKIING